ncbi:MFS transporter [Pseudooceanicola nitratireducens]|uniref:MFS transporter n=1 Tax=Pseudooceanicola nitratireducens TaxID=517719 RepID=UPI001C949932|nr:MFS transporter [Pseudooceanicola nitratireducens]MBY6157672.1 MFS transporter [Pseudooceanicola nitratireducens]
MKFFALMLAPLCMTTCVFVFAGVLDPMAEDLGVSVGVAGQLQSIFTIACALFGPVLAVATQRLDRKAILATTLGTLALLNAATAMMTAFPALAVLRFLTGAAGSLALPMASTIAIMLVGPERRARALALVYAGVSLAFLTGIPLGSTVGAAFGWQSSFWLAAGLSALSFVMVLAFVPRVATPPAPPKGAFAAVMRWPTTGYLLVTLCAFAAIFAAIGYIGPVVTSLTGLTGHGVGVIQMLSGVGSFLGLTLGARLVERQAQGPLVILFTTILLSQGIFAIALIQGWSGSAGLTAVVIGMLVGSTSLFGTAPIVQSRMADAAGPAATLAFALNGSMVYLGQGVGVMLGGMMLGAMGLPFVSTAGMGVALLGILLALALRHSRLRSAVTPT